MEDSQRAEATERRRTRSCAECRRRRIRCDGQTVPCSQCVYYQVVDRCHYPQRRERRVPTTKISEEASSAHNACRGVIETLFPGQDVTALQNLSRDELLSIASVASPQTPSTQAGARGMMAAGPSSESPTASIPGFEPSRIHEFIWDESVDRTTQGSPWDDDVNGMSALFDTESGRSYLGISSVPSILHVMAHTSAPLRQAIAEKKRRNDSSPFMPSMADPAAGHPIMDELSLVDAYFRTVHIVIPMVNEMDFRRCYAHGTTEKARGPWLALLNMVLALGYIALNNDGQAGHAYFADQASEHMNISSFALGHLHILQALVLYGGYYLHFLNKPNMASAVMGAAHRMALAMGLHQPTPRKGFISTDHQQMMETRLRTWWCLFALDTWAGTTLGRPLSGSWDPSSLARPSTAMLSETDYERISLNATASFSVIAARIQDRMARASPVPPSELDLLDAEVVSWYENAHPILHSGRHSPERIRLASLLLQYRYMNLRMLLYRPYLLVQSIKAGTQEKSPNAQGIAPLADKCCSLAKENIELIMASWYPNQVLAWNSSWFLFQACLVLLLRLLSQSTPSSEVDAYEEIIARSLQLLVDMRPWRVSVAQTHDLILFIFSARTATHQTWDSNWSVSDEELMNLLGFGGMLTDCNWNAELGLDG